jgi:hypothetical protein
MSDRPLRFSLSSLSFELKSRGGTEDGHRAQLDLRGSLDNPVLVSGFGGKDAGVLELNTMAESYV